jgi:hypothetical protein
VELVSFDGNCFLLPVGKFYLGRVVVGVEFALYDEAGLGGGVGYEAHDGLVGGQWSAAPVDGDLGEQPVLDLVPFAGAGRVVADDDL